MELRQLQTFMTVLQAGSFSKAAEKLQYAQSTITLHIQQLETELKAELFIRNGKRLVLSEAGRLLKERAAVITGQIDDLEQLFLELEQGSGGDLRLGAIEPIASLRLPALLAEFAKTHGKVRLKLEIAGARSLAERIAGGELDLAISAPPPARLGIGYEPLFEEKLVMLLPENHPLTLQEKITVTDLSQYSFICTGGGCSYRQVTEDAVLERGVLLSFQHEISSMEMVKLLVAAGLGIAFVPVSGLAKLPATTVTREVAGLDIRLTVGLIYQVNASISKRSIATLCRIFRRELATV